MARRSTLRGPYKMPYSSEELFWQKVDKSGECWIWLAGRKGGRNRNYGSFIVGGRLKKRQWYAHRYSYFIHKGEIPEGMDIMHLCDNGLCVNPDHLQAGTHEENMADAYKKDRIKCFGKVPLCTHSERVEIKQMLAPGISINEIANKFELPEVHIRRLKSGYRGAYLY